MGIADLIALKPTLLKRKPNSQLDQHLSFFSKSCMEKSRWMNLKIWIVGYDLTKFVRCIAQLSVQAHLFPLSCRLSLLK